MQKDATEWNIPDLCVVIKDMYSKMAKHDNQFIEMKSKVDGNTEEITKLAERVDSLEKKLSKERKDNNEMHERMLQERIENAVVIKSFDYDVDVHTICETLKFQAGIPNDPIKAYKFSIKVNDPKNKKKQKKIFLIHMEFATQNDKMKVFKRINDHGKFSCEQLDPDCPEGSMEHMLVVSNAYTRNNLIIKRKFEEIAKSFPKDSFRHTYRRGKWQYKRNKGDKWHELISFDELELINNTPSEKKPINPSNKRPLGLASSSPPETSIAKKHSSDEHNHNTSSDTEFQEAH
jgi:hypothetical protein